MAANFKSSDYVQLETITSQREELLLMTETTGSCSIPDKEITKPLRSVKQLAVSMQWVTAIEDCGKSTFTAWVGFRWVCIFV